MEESTQKDADKLYQLSWLKATAFWLKKGTKMTAECVNNFSYVKTSEK